MVMPFVFHLKAQGKVRSSIPIVIHFFFKNYRGRFDHRFDHKSHLFKYFLIVTLKITVDFKTFETSWITFKLA